MNKLFFEGRLAAAPELASTASGAKFAKFRLLRNEFAGMDGDNRMERTVEIQFTAWGRMAEMLAKNAMTGDQLILVATIRNNNYERGGETVYSFNFEVLEVEFGAPGKAKRERLAA